MPTPPVPSGTTPGDRPPESPGRGPDRRADIAVVGAGIVGLHNALQYARRGYSVILLDEQGEAQTGDYKVGESLLIFSNAFLRTIGGLEKELSGSFVKQGFWMV